MTNQIDAIMVNAFICGLAIALNVFTFGHWISMLAAAVAGFCGTGAWQERQSLARRLR